MGWTDKSCIKTIKQLKNDFDIPMAIETGTFRAQSTRVFSTIFEKIISCEINKDYFSNAILNHCQTYQNITILNVDSGLYLNTLNECHKRNIINNTILFYLDAHFYDPNLSEDEKFVIVRELQSLKDFNNCIIIIHDFDNKELGHIKYDGIPMDINLIGKYLKEINPNFNYYTNTKEFCDILTLEDLKEDKMHPLEVDEENIDSLNYVWKSEDKTYRGILYCIPKKLDLSKYNLKEFLWS